MDQKNYRYVVLYVLGAEQSRFKQIFEQNMSKERCEVFIPCMEYYRRGEKTVKERPIFPGYIFLYTDLNMKEVHELVRIHRKEIATAMRELALYEHRTNDPDFLFREEDDSSLFDLSDVDETEKEFLDYLRKGNGLLKMSSGYEYKVINHKEKDRRKRIQKKYKVMEGPLAVYEDRITEVDKHNRKAFLEFEINGRCAQAGFNCLPKAHWFPAEDAKSENLPDFGKADLEELKRKMMTAK